ncbi:MAG: DUF6049 family protein [Acidimicrobiales bacterium]
MRRLAVVRGAGLVLVMVVSLLTSGTSPVGQPAGAQAGGAQAGGPQAGAAQPAEPAAPSPESGPAAPQGPAGQLTLVSQTPWVAPSGDFELHLGVAGVIAPETAEVVVRVYQAVTSRSQFRQTLEGKLLGEELWQSQPSPVGALGADGTDTVPVPVSVTVGLQTPGVATDPGRLTLVQPGVHPVEVELRDTATGVVMDRLTTHLVRQRSDAAAALAVAWLQPFAAPPALRPDGSMTLDEPSKAALATTAEALADTGAGLTVVPRPETLEALAAVGPSLLSELSGNLARRQVVGEPYVPIDVDALVGSGLTEEVAAQRSRGSEVISTALQAPHDNQTWVSEGPISAVALDALTGVRRLVVPEQALDPLDRSLTLASPFLVESSSGRSIEAAAVDEGLAAHFSEGGDQVLAANHLLADLAVLAYDAPGLTRGVVVRPPPGWAPSTPFLATVLAGLSQGPVVRAVTLDQLFAQVPRASTDDTGLVRTLAPRPTPPLELADQVRRVRADVTSFAAMAGPAAAQVDAIERLLLMATGSLSQTERGAYLDATRAAVGARLSMVGILSEGSFRLTSRKATVPLTLVNRLDVDMQVSLGLESDKLDFTGTSPPGIGSTTLALTLHPGNTPVMIPVEARTSGDFPLLITMRSPDGRLEVVTTRLTVRSTFLSGVGVTLSAGAGLFLLGWWVSHWRTARRDRRLVKPPGGEPLDAR